MLHRLQKINNSEWIEKPLDVSLSLSFNGIASKSYPVGVNISVFRALDTPQTLTYAEQNAIMPPK